MRFLSTVLGACMALQAVYAAAPVHGSRASLSLASGRATPRTEQALAFAKGVSPAGSTMRLKGGGANPQVYFDITIGGENKGG
jgi:hypothetical protein